MRKGNLLIGTAILTAAIAGVANAVPDRRGGDGSAMMPGAAPDDPPINVQALKGREARRFSEADVNGNGRKRDYGEDDEYDEYGEDEQHDDENNEYGEDEEHEHEEHEDEEDEDEERGESAGPAPAGTTGAPDNGLIVPGSKPEVNSN